MPKFGFLLEGYKGYADRVFGSPPSLLRARVHAKPQLPF